MKANVEANFCLYKVKYFIKSIDNFKTTQGNNCTYTRMLLTNY